MTPIVESIEISRPPDDVFSYATDPAALPEWQESLISVRTAADEPVDGTIEPLGGGERSRVTIALDFKGRGIGRLLVPLVVRRQARAELPRNLQRLKERLEGGA
jgi:Polyketide cyclase / dehydrase and lipid transport